MSSPFGIAALLVGPGVRSSADTIRSVLEAGGVEHRFEALGHAAEAERHAQAAIAGGLRFLIAVGGDDVVHHVVNGIFAEGSREGQIVLGVIAAGADNEFLRQFGLPLDAERACRHMTGENVYPIDVGSVRCAGEDGATHSSYFANIGSVGLGATFAERTAGIDGSATRRRVFLGFWRAVLTAKRARVHVEAARKVYDGLAYDVVVGNGRFGPGGFRVSPRSFPGDGVLEVLVHHGPRSHAFTSLPKAYRGEQVPSPHITELRGNHVRVEAVPPLPVAVDGLPLGRTPADFEVLAQAILLKV